MPAKATQNVTAASSFTLAMAYGDNELFLGVSGTFIGLSFKIEGNRNGVYYPIAVFSSTEVGPLNAPLTPTDQTATGYTGRCDIFSDLKITTIAIGGGQANYDLLTGSFFGSPAPSKVIGAGGTIGVSGAVSVNSDSRGNIETLNGAVVQLILDKRTRNLVDELVEEVRGLRQDIQIGLNVDPSKS